MHEPMKANSLKDGLHKPTFHEDGLHAPMKADNLKDGLHKPTFHEDGLQAVGRVRRQFQGLSSQVHSHEMACMRQEGSHLKDGTPVRSLIQYQHR